MPMLTEPSKKYKSFDFKPNLPDRKWPDVDITKPPRWLSSDLRDGNQALVNPMNIEQKTRFFNLLVNIGFKEIEVAYPAASDTDFGFVRNLVEGRVHVPDDVWLQVLSPAREDLIRRTFESVRGSNKAIFHMYNAVSCLFRRVVFNNDRAQTKELAVRHIQLIRDLVDEDVAAGGKTDWQLEYSPETFTQTEPEFVVEVCDAVQDVWFKGKDRTKEHPIIFNLPATVEVATPNRYADQIEYFSRNIRDRASCVISLHTHNDRGTGVAATEQGLMAGAQRVEGCLFGNGERTGNVCLEVVALNLYTQGIHPNLDFSDMDTIIRIVTECNQLPVHPRHPYAGELVFTAFSGSHQDAIKKGFGVQKKQTDSLWDMPYLPIDPHDIACNYEAIIRVNSQSGKAGAASIIQENLGLDLPRKMQVAFYSIVQEVADRSGKEITVPDIIQCFRKAYCFGDSFQGRYSLENFSVSYPNTPESASAKVPNDHKCHFEGTILNRGVSKAIEGSGNGHLSAVLDALNRSEGVTLDVKEYSEHTIKADKNSQAAAYVQLVSPEGKAIWGVGVDEDVATASLRALIGSVNGHCLTEEEQIVSTLQAVTAPNGPAVNGK